MTSKEQPKSEARSLRVEIRLQLIAGLLESPNLSHKNLDEPWDSEAE